jgi:hypothetical protein
MSEKRYEVLICDVVHASNMNMDVAMILVKALLENTDGTVSIREMPRATMLAEDDYIIFTREEVSRMTDAQTKEHYKDILHSMKHWEMKGL